MSQSLQDSNELEVQNFFEAVGNGAAFAILDDEYSQSNSNGSSGLDGIYNNRAEIQVAIGSQLLASHGNQNIQLMNHDTDSQTPPPLNATGSGYCVQQQEIVPVSENDTHFDAMCHSMPSNLSFGGLYGSNVPLSVCSSTESVSMADGKKRQSSGGEYSSQQSTVADCTSPIFRMNDFPYQAAVNSNLAASYFRHSDQPISPYYGSDDVSWYSGREFNSMPAFSRIHAVQHRSLLPCNVEQSSSRRTLTSIAQSNNVHIPSYINQSNTNGEISMNGQIQNHPTLCQILQQTLMQPDQPRVDPQQWDSHNEEVPQHNFPSERSSHPSPMDKIISMKADYSKSNKRSNLDEMSPKNPTLPPQFAFTSDRFFPISGSTITPIVNHVSPEAGMSPIGTVTRYGMEELCPNLTREHFSGPKLSEVERQATGLSCYNSTSSKDKFQCIDCLKKNPPKECLYMRTESTGEGRCRRCYEKFKKNLKADTPPSFSYDPNLGGLDAALEYCYASWPPLRLTNNQEDDWEQYDDAEAEWVERFIMAAVQPYEINTDGTSEESLRQWLVDQQTIFNKSPYEKTGGHWFTNKWVNHRFVMLFYAILNLHRGGRRPYPQGGDNGGYGKIDATMTCSTRLKMIEEMLRKDKRIVINVIEGQHVCALAENPRGVMKRKSSNKSTNMKKAEAQEYAKTMKEREREENDKSVVTSIEGDQVEHDELVDARLGGSRKRKRGFTQASTDAVASPARRAQNRAPGALVTSSPHFKKHGNQDILDWTV